MARLPAPPLIDRARAHAEQHPECAALLAELIARIDGQQNEIRRRAFGVEEWTAELEHDGQVAWLLEAELDFDTD